MTVEYQQTDTSTSLTPNDGTCSGTSSAGWGARIISVGGTAGSTETTQLIAAGGTRQFQFTSGIDDSYSLDSGTWTVRVNITTSNMNVEIDQVIVCRRSVFDGSAAIANSGTGLAISCATTGVKTVNLTGSAISHVTSDSLVVTVVFSNTNTMSGQTVGLTPTEIITSPFTASADITVTPSTQALTTAKFAPTVTASDHKTVTPGVIALSLSEFAPTVTASDNRTVTPGTVTLTTSAFEPAVAITENQLVTPSTVALSTSLFAPTVDTTEHQTVTPSTASLSLSVFAPSVTGGAGLTVIPGTISLSLSEFAPTITTTDHKVVIPGTVALSLSEFAPTVSTPVTIVPITTDLVSSLFAPSISFTDHKTVIPDTTTLTLNLFAPTVSNGIEALVVYNRGMGAAQHVRRAMRRGR